MHVVEIHDSELLARVSLNDHSDVAGHDDSCMNDYEAEDEDEGEQGTRRRPVPVRLRVKSKEASLSMPQREADQLSWNPYDPR